MMVNSAIISIDEAMMWRCLSICSALLTCGMVLSLRAATVGLISVHAAISPATAGYISRAVDIAAQRQDACLVIQLDTPGGLLESTKEIVQKLYSSPIPTIVYVNP